MRQYYAVLLSLLVLIRALLWPASAPLFAQEDHDSLYLQDIQGTKDDKGNIAIIGKVVNPLPWPVADVEVTVMFEEDAAQPLSQTKISSVSAGGSSLFAITRSNAAGLQHFRSGVTDFSVVSEDVAALLTRYKTSQNIVLRTGIAQAFNGMKAPTLVALLDCIDVAQRGAAVALDQWQNDLLCMDGLAAVGDSRAVQPLLDLASWYDSQDLGNLLASERELDSNLLTPLTALSVMKALPESKDTMAGLVEAALAQIGEDAAPELLQASTSGQLLTRDIASRVLATLHKDSAEALLADQDPARLTKIVTMLGKLGRQDAVIPLLELAHAQPGLRQAVEDSLIQIGAGGVPGLVTALQHHTGAVAEHAEAVLRRQCPAIQGELGRELAASGGTVTGQNCLALVAALKARADEQIDTRIDQAFAVVQKEFQAGDCVSLGPAVAALTAIRDTSARHDQEMPPILACMAKAMADQGDYEQALAYGVQADHLAPGNQDLQVQLADWLTVRGQTQAKRGDTTQALATLRAARQRVPAHREAMEAYGHIVLSANLIYLLVGALLALIFLVALAVHQPRQALTPAIGIAATVALGLRAWLASGSPLTVVWLAVGAVFLAALALAMLAPSRSVHRLAYAYACGILFLVLWFSPVAGWGVSSATGRPSWPIVALFAVIGIAFLAVAWYLRERSWLMPALQQRRFITDLTALLSEPGPATLNRLARSGAVVPTSWADDVLRQHVSAGSLPGWAYLAQHPEIPIARRALRFLGEAIPRADPALRAGLLRLFYDRVQESPETAWQVSLDELLGRDQATALRACQEQLVRGEVTPLLRLLHSARPDVFISGIDGLKGTTGKLPPAELDKLATYLAEEVLKRPPKQGATLVAALLDIRPGVLTQLMSGSNSALLAAWRTALAEKRPGIADFWRHSLLDAMTPSWSVACGQALQIARVPDGKTLVEEQTGAAAMRLVLAQTVIDSRGLQKQELAKLLAASDPDTGWSPLADTLTPPQLTDTAVLLRSDRPEVRRLVHAALKAVAERNPACRAQLETLLVGIFCEEHGDVGREGLRALIEVHPQLAGVEAALRRLVSENRTGEFLAWLTDPEEVLRAAAGRGLTRAFTHSTDRTFQQTILAGLQRTYDLPIAMARQVAVGELILVDCLYPFTVRPLEEEAGDFHLEEMVNEPEDSITGSRITTWVYRQAGQITHLILAGHANAPVCREVSAKLFTAFLEHGGNLGNEGLFVPGAFFMPAPHGSQHSGETLPPLDDLVNQLALVQDTTGLLQVRETNGEPYHAVRDLAVDEIARAHQAKAPAWIGHDELGPGRAIMLPFFDLAGDALAPVTLDISLDLFQSKEFTELLQIHRNELRNEMIADAHRRRRIYQEWLSNDEMGLLQSSRKMFERLLPSASNVFELAMEYAQMQRQQPAEFAQYWSPGLPLPSRQQLTNLGAGRLRAFLNTQTPGAISSDAQWNALLSLIQKLDQPVRGTRNFVDASVSMDGELSYISLQESTDFNLPGLIQADLHWIGLMDQLLKKFDEADPAREARMDLLNLGTLLDAFLRGWPPVFLSSESARVQYRAWCADRREPVWREIWRCLMAKKLRMDPLQADNVVFAIQKSGGTTLRITPYFLTTDRSYAVFVDPRYGITHYLRPWQYRQRILATRPKKNKRRAAQDECVAGENALGRGDTTEAVDRFKRALRIHPVAATEGILDAFWAQTTADTATELRDLLRFGRALDSFRKAPNTAGAEIEWVLERYPHFLPDPYLALGYLKHPLSATVGKVKQALDELLAKQKELIHTLEHEHVLIPQGDSSLLSGERNYQVRLYQNDVINAQRFDRLKRAQEDIAAYQRQLAVAEAQVWRQLEAEPNDPVMEAMSLDAEHTTRVLHGGTFIWSQGYGHHVLSLNDLPKAVEYLEIVRGLQKALGSEDEDMLAALKNRAESAQAQVLKKLRQGVEQCMHVQSLDEEDIAELKELRELLEQSTLADSILRENILRSRFDTISSDYVRRAYQIIRNAASAKPEIATARQQLSDCQHRICNYRHAMLTVRGGPTAAVLSAFPRSRFLISDPAYIPLQGVNLVDTDSIGAEASGVSRPVLQYTHLNEEERRHLAAEFIRPEYVGRLQASGLTPAYAILLTPIAVPPHTARWQAVLDDLSEWLIKVFAYLGVPPADRSYSYRDELLASSDEAAVVETVVVDPNAMRTAFLSSRAVERI